MQDIRRVNVFQLSFDGKFFRFLRFVPSNAETLPY